MLVSKWGNSLAVRLPQSVVEALELREGDHIDVRLIDERAFSVEKTPTTQKLLARLRKYRSRLPEGFHFDRLEANDYG